MNQQLPARNVRDYLPEDLEGLTTLVTMPDFEAEHFELNPVIFNILNTLDHLEATQRGMQDSTSSLSWRFSTHAKSMESPTMS
ncbi:hypothetical protein GQ457_09G016970 [Hibiscus cannabinus]